MNKYIAIMRQKDEGCDYTVGCGVRVEEFEAEGPVEAVKQAIVEFSLEDYAKGEGDPIHYLSGGESELIELKILHVHEDGIDLLPLLQEWSKSINEFRRKFEKNKERAELERLRKKYE